jgi:predicted MFS family arabinose efflux permease
MLAVAAALGLASAVSLGLARFAYALLLPSMREDLAWSYLTAGALNTANAAGYLMGALLLPRLLRRFDARGVMLAGGAGTALLLAAHGMVSDNPTLFVLRALAGAASAASFVAGGLLAARLASGTAVPPGPAGSNVMSSPTPQRNPRSAGLVLGIYYGGTGLGIIVSAWLVPAITTRPVAHAWQAAWLALALVALLATGVTAWMTRHLTAAPNPSAARVGFAWSRFAFGLAGYLMFGLGYIGYMTFIITLLREQRVADAQIVAFYIVLGLAVMASSWLWAGLLQRCRGGGALALLNALLALATLLPVLSAHPVLVFGSGALFGAVFLSVVASTTALVRHNLPASAWASGISAFTIVFAAGQIVGPSLVGWVADGSGGLARGFVWSAGLLALGALLAWRQRPLAAAG